MAFTDLAYGDLRKKRIKTFGKNNLMWLLRIVEDGFGKASRWYSSATLSAGNSVCSWGAEVYQRMKVVLAANLATGRISLKCQVAVFVFMYATLL